VKAMIPIVYARHPYVGVRSAVKSLTSRSTHNAPTILKFCMHISNESDGDFWVGSYNAP